ncbi:MAG: hypothetical protein Q9208_001878 [Pyrenodesmia sp. 3 TL-2023]
MPSVQEDIIRADRDGHPMRTALPQDGRPSTMPFPIDPSDSDPAAYAMPAHQEKINLFPAVPAAAVKSTIPSSPTTTDGEPKSRNPAAADFKPHTRTELDVLYTEYREASARHISTGAQMDEFKDRMTNGDEQGHDLRWLQQVSSKLAHKFADVADEKQRILETIGKKYGREALKPVEEVNGQLVKTKEELKELSKELSMRMPTEMLQKDGGNSSG